MFKILTQQLRPFSFSPRCPPVTSTYKKQGTLDFLVCCRSNGEEKTRSAIRLLFSSSPLLLHQEKIDNLFADLCNPPGLPNFNLILNPS
ncbi:hypothetical protein HanRHA438_Chr14g0674491 [Helianthus annuus]|uniref:Uncharacterized protein n=1 Tax=Helianthus annuus TaxID=4232 RepID=A0A251SHD7_HELAN|nr:hypothetical protein HanXRQr2_Chr14g0663341 [Helianthus annuus]KAJ0465656.1 hypothetical protein HanHA300_Chr14g0540601 [Helianthus annuus]KAJ0470530.1 hypothetical protein HanIR_Chr14g0719761 [Helianthus annuus]KAJ0487249.1 hypothetical protein HanHA89_Chr14g0588371 [Helianthus annuus]KAJ0841989.1 hypothetical protein HanPSC8_Chr14g0636611 [Helianthus annuus]